MGPDSVRTLDIWSEGMTLVKAVYGLTAGWPRAEGFGLTAQIRRAAVAIPANIAEGVGRGTPAEAARFANVALGSLYELDTLIQLAADLGYAEPVAATRLRQHLSSLARRISNFVQYKRQRGQRAQRPTAHNPLPTT